MLRGRMQTMLARLPPGGLEALEIAVQLAQGKGWGAATVTAEVAAIRSLLGPQADRKLTILDVGANRGTWTQAALAAFPAAEIHAFEPATASFAALTLTVGNDRRVTLHQFALGSSDTEATLFADTPGSGLASLTKRRLDHFDLPPMAAQERVQVRELSGWLDEAAVASVDVLKLDVEGHELEIMQSMGQRLADVKLIQFEFGGTNIDTRTYLQDFWYLLTSHGFRLNRLTPRGLVPVDRYRENDEVFVTTNFFAVR